MPATYSGFPGAPTASAAVARTSVVSRRLLLLATLAASVIWQPPVSGHGQVVAENDACLISIGFLKAHFFMYQPLADENKEYCEDVPEVAETVFVVNYLHDFLKEIPVDFRIVRDTRNFGANVNWDDIAAMEDIEENTVLYQAPSTRPDGVLSVKYGFQEAGSYIGIVTARHPAKDTLYNAVFQFQVGGGRYRSVALIVLLLVLVQAGYWVSNRRLKRPPPPDAR